ncbi:MAG TPA: hypothetical protein ENJ09_01280 [Planctomycetes bacterium]|nr:hypothetical protein [Planctomycetota bacterium]
MVREKTNVAFERRALSILEAVLDLAPTDRARTLESLCGADEELLDRVQELLDSEGLGELERVAGLPTLGGFLPSAPEEFIPGGRVGNYELLRPIARGGMGWVFEAEQKNPKRRVAIKMLRFGADSPEVRRRFELESDVLARLEHPRIAKVFEAGVHLEDGVAGKRETPYLVLEYVEGATPITEYVRREGLGAKEVVDLAISVCDAVQHGHQKGVVHRDLKSGNVLVDGNGRVKVIDFGVARILGSGLEAEGETTRVGQLIGTLETMSPEQFSADPEDVDTRSDVYSLGGLLFELLTGSPLRDLAGKPMGEVARIIQEQDPVSPRSLVPELDRDLEAILLRALAREREDRYESAAALGEDLRRFQRSMPVEARRPTALRRARLLARRNPVSFVAAVVVALTLLVATLVSTRFAIVANRASEQKDKEIIAANLAREAEAAALERSRALEGDLLEFTEGVSGELVGQLEEAGATPSVQRAAAEFTVKRIESLRERAAGDVPTLVSLAKSYMALGDTLGNPTQSNLGDIAAAEDAYRQAEEIGEEVERLDREGPDARYIAGWLEQRRGDLARGRSEWGEAKERYRSASELFSELEREYPEDRFLEACVASDAMLGTILGGVDHDYEAANALFLSALENQESLAARHPGDESHRRNADILRTKLAMGYSLLGRFEEGAAQFEVAVRHAEESVERHPDNLGERRSLVETLGSYIRSLVDSGRFEEAEKELRRALELARALVEDGDRDLRILAMDPYLTGMRGLNELRWARGTSGQKSSDHLAAARAATEHSLAGLGALKASGQWNGMLGFVEASAKDTLAEIEEQEQREE